MQNQEDTRIAVTVVVVPGGAQAVLVDEGATVADALREAGKDADGYQVRLDGRQVSTDKPLSAGDRIVLTRQIKGNQEEDTRFSVTVVQVPGSAKAVLVDEGDTIGDAIEAAGFDADGHQVRVDGRQVSTGADVTAGQRIVLTRQIKGN